ncbi:hypothetical protein B0H14DRAFT_2632054 [Mycena olivaceomarginata]|nr:hypothetical protein B0H14DRAFT_2632054 [Mycena olivaceomarginata]
MALAGCENVRLNSNEEYFEPETESDKPWMKKRSQRKRKDLIIKEQGLIPGSWIEWLQKIKWSQITGHYWDNIKTTNIVHSESQNGGVQYENLGHHRVDSNSRKLRQVSQEFLNGFSFLDKLNTTGEMTVKVLMNNSQLHPDVIHPLATSITENNSNYQAAQHHMDLIGEEPLGTSAQHSLGIKQPDTVEKKQELDRAARYWASEALSC